MHLSRIVTTFAPALIVAGAVGYSALGSAEPVAQGAAQRDVGIDASSLSPLRAPSGTDRVHRCAVHDPSSDQIAAIEDAVERAGRNTASGGLVSVPVYWHIITPAGGGANVSALVPAQMQVLNDAYASSGFRLVLQSVQVVPNTAWFTSRIGSAEEAAMKAALRQGGPEALNIYTTNGDVYLGWATPAFFYKFQPSYDGVVLWWATLPGTGLAGTDPDEPDGVLTYDKGDTATHEVGHWLGLNHTFAGGCSHPGDSIKDTPAEAGPQFFCAPRDSCTARPFPGTDPITNFMDYVDDVCMNHFTADQTGRMRRHWHAFRDKKAR